MATDVSFNRRTRSSSCGPCVTPTRSPRLARTAESEANRCGVKRRMVYQKDGSAEDGSPAKRLRTPVKSPSKRLATKSFYGGTKASYLTPLERKRLSEIRKKNCSPTDPSMEDMEPAPAAARKPRASKRTPKSGSKEKNKKIPSIRSPSLAVNKPQSHLRDIVPGSTKSPVKSSQAPPADSPSWKQRKFFKSKRKIEVCKQPAIVVKKGLQVKYKPKGITRRGEAKAKSTLDDLSNRLTVNKTTERKTKMDSSKISSRKVTLVNTSPNLSSELTVDSSEGTPRLVGKVGTPKTRTPIHSSKNPNSQELLAISDWDLDTESADEALAVSAATPEELDSSMELLSSLFDSGNVSYPSARGLPGTRKTNDGLSNVSNCSTAGDSVDLLSDLSQFGSPHSAADTESSFERDPMVYSIFKTRQNPQQQVDNCTPDSSMKRWQFKGSEGRQTRRQRLVEKDGREQMTLDFGQKLRGAVQCPTCGMTYSHGDPSDETIHKKFHTKLLSALKFNELKNGNVLQQYEDGSRILVVMGDQRVPMKKVLAVKKIVDQDLGFVVDSNGIKRTSKVFMYVSENDRIIGFCVAEHIRKAYRVIPGTGTNSSTERSEPLCCDTKPERARCGINRIWVLCSERRHKVASKLLDCVRENFLLGFPLEKDQLAFTDPTPDGRSFSARYIGKENFLVYKHSP